MDSYRVELRASPDTPEEEEKARRQGRALGPQTVIFPNIMANSAQHAVEIAISYEKEFLYRKKIRLFCDPILSKYYKNNMKYTMPYI